MGGGISSRTALIEGINVTPLVDITLVLLLMFMVTAKLVVAEALPLDLPVAQQTEAVQSILAVGVRSDGQLELDGQTIHEGTLVARARRALADDHAVRAVIHADGSVPHRRVIAVLDRLKEAGLLRVAFAARPTTQQDIPESPTASDDGP